jgi:hypothetical protein
LKDGTAQIKQAARGEYRAGQLVWIKDLAFFFVLAQKKELRLGTEGELAFDWREGRLFPEEAGS